MTKGADTLIANARTGICWLTLPRVRFDVLSGPLGGRHAVVTEGSGGIVFRSEGNSGRIPAHPVDAVDTEPVPATALPLDTSGLEPRAQRSSKHWKSEFSSQRWHAERWGHSHRFHTEMRSIRCCGPSAGASREFFATPKA